jgi:hydrogenase expression/formation protein HypC
MCLGIPGEVQSVTDGDDLRMGRVTFGGIVKEVCLAYVPEARPGDFVIIHAGFAISRIDREAATRVFAYLDEIGLVQEAEENAATSKGEGER